MSYKITDSMDLLNWLLEPGDLPVRYRTLTELMDKDPDSGEIKELKDRLPDYKPAKKLLDAMHPDGYWLHKNAGTGKVLGDGVEYGSFGTTHFCLAYCAELGLDRTHPLIAKAAERYLDLQKEDGDWWRHLSCLYAYNIRTFLLLGYRGDARVDRAVRMMLDIVRPDGGYLCDLHEKGKAKRPKSCIRGSAKALLALAELPEYWNHDRCVALADYFLNREGIYRAHDRERFVNRDMEGNSFPVTWGANVWEILYALGKMGYGNDARLKRAWEELDGRADDAGRFTLDWTPAQCPWKVGKRGEPNKWVTLYCLLAKKYRG